MPTTKTIAAGRETQAVVTSQTTRVRAFVIQGARLRSWKTVLFASLGREIHSLHIQQQERAFMATGHGVNYRAVSRETVTLH